MYHATCLDQVPFDIPVTFTLAPHDPDVDEDGFKRYASRMNGLSEGEFYTILTGEPRAAHHKHCVMRLLIVGVRARLSREGEAAHQPCTCAIQPCAESVQCSILWLTAALELVHDMAIHGARHRLHQLLPIVYLA